MFYHVIKYFQPLPLIDIFKPNISELHQEPVTVLVESGKLTVVHLSWFIIHPGIIVSEAERYPSFEMLTPKNKSIAIR